MFPQTYIVWGNYTLSNINQEYSENSLVNPIDN